MPPPRSTITIKVILIYGNDNIEQRQNYSGYSMDAEDYELGVNIGLSLSLSLSVSLSLIAILPLGRQDWYNQLRTSQKMFELHV